MHGRVRHKWVMSTRKIDIEWQGMTGRVRTRIMECRVGGEYEENLYAVAGHGRAKYNRVVRGRTR